MMPFGIVNPVYHLSGPILSGLKSRRTLNKCVSVGYPFPSSFKNASFALGVNCVVSK